MSAALEAPGRLCNLRDGQTDCFEDMASEELLMTDGFTLMDAMSAFEVRILPSYT